MNNPFLLPPRERLVHWKQFRLSLPGLPEGEQLQRVAQYWAQAPLSRIAYDAEDVSQWPTAWEMVNAGEWCACSVAAGMEATLRLAGWDAARLVLRHIHDLDICDVKLVVEIDGIKLLNYDHAIVIDRPATRQIEMARWQFTGKIYGRVVA